METEGVFLCGLLSSPFVYNIYLQCNPTRQRLMLSTGSWSHSCCNPTCSKHWTGPLQRPGPCGQLCEGLPRFPQWWKSGLACWTLPPVCLLLKSLDLCFFEGHSPPKSCDPSPLRSPLDGSWTDPRKYLMQQIKHCRINRFFSYTNTLALSMMCTIIRKTSRWRRWVTNPRDISHPTGGSIFPGSETQTKHYVSWECQNSSSLPYFEQLKQIKINWPPWEIQNIVILDTGVVTRTIYIHFYQMKAWDITARVIVASLSPALMIDRLHREPPHVKMTARMNSRPHSFTP